MVDQDSFTRVNNDINGNPRFVLHFLHFVGDNEIPRTAPDLSRKNITLHCHALKVRPFMVGNSITNNMVVGLYFAPIT